MNDDLISRKELIAILNKLNLSMTDVTMQRYANSGFIDKPTFHKKGQGAQAYYSVSTLGQIYAIGTLTKVGLRLFEIQNIVKLWLQC